jgi:formiminoglutamase
MTWNSCYQPPDATLWHGRDDLPPASCFFQIIRMLNLDDKTSWPDPKDTFQFALLGFSCDEGIRRNLGRVGAVEGPAAIRQMLAKLPIHKHHFQLFDAGDILCINRDLEKAQEALSDAVHMLLSKKITPILLGGGHEIAWGHYQGIRKTFSDNNLGIVNFDAHFDMRPKLTDDKGSSGTPFLQIAEIHQLNQRRFDYNCVGIQPTGNTSSLFETARKHNTNILLAEDLHLKHAGKVVDFIDRIIDQNEMIYLSLCLDVFASAFAPGVSSTQPLGLFPWQIIPMVRALAASGKVISYDIAELCPLHDISNNTAKLAATLVYEFIHHHNEEPRDW